MKVLSYLEYNCFLAVLNEEKREIAKKFLQFVKSKGFDNERDFYAQPFKPELIPELFEGWDERHYQYGVFYVYINKSQEVHFDNDRYYAYKIYFDTISKPIEYYTPRTLDEFITDCQRAGIELKWRTK